MKAGEVGPMVVFSCLVDVADSLANNDCVAKTLCSLGDIFIISSEGLFGPPHSPVSLYNSGPHIVPTKEESHGGRT